MKYFFLSDSWTTGRVWEFGGLWNELAWNRKPHLQKQPLYVQENGENLWLYQAEDAILMVEVMPKSVTHPTIGQVVLKRLLTPEQVVDRLCKENVFHPPDFCLDPRSQSSAAHDRDAADPKNLRSASAQNPVDQKSVQTKEEQSVSVMARLRKLATGKAPAKSKSPAPAQVS